MKLNLALLATAAFANANAASKLYICATPQNSDLTQADYEALSWVEIKFVGSLGETGKSTNVLSYDTWDTTVIQKAKGMTDAGSPELEVARTPSDAGQDILRAAAVVGNNNNYAFKELRADGTTSTNGSVRYNRGLVMGPRYPGGRNEDFDLEVYTLGFQQEPIIVDPGAGGNAPVMTVAPVITTDGTPAVGETITVNNGTFTGDATITYTYQWFAGGVAIAGATTNSLLLTSAQLGKVITARVHATNNSGSAQGYSAPTAAVV
ncbi:hypothetical protein [Rhizobium phage RHph_X2_24]|nr:hypothetical protein [Rhizobium phage RHph_X2_24]